MKTLLISLLLFSFPSLYAATLNKIVFSESFDNQGSFTLMGSGLSIAGGEIYDDGHGFLSFPAKAQKINGKAFELAVGVAFNDVQKPVRFLFVSNAFHIEINRTNLNLRVIQRGVATTLSALGVLKQTGRIYNVGLLVNNGRINLVLDGKIVKSMAQKSPFAFPNLYVAGTPWYSRLVGLVDNFQVTTNSNVVVPPPPPSSLPPVGLFVSPTGPINGDGSISKPFPTIAKGLAGLTPGKTLFLRGGQYYESITLNKNGSSSAPIIIKNYPNEVPVINGAIPLTLRKMSVPDPKLPIATWSSVYYGSVPTSSLAGGVPQLVDGDRFLRLAQTPNRPHDVFLQPADFDPITLGDGATSYIQDSYFSGRAANYWNGNIYNSSGVLVADYKTQVSVKSHNANNNIVESEIVSSGADTVNLSPFLPPIDATMDGFVLQNHPSAFDQAGEFLYLDDASGTTHFYVRPFGAVPMVEVIKLITAVKPQSGALNGNFTVIDGLKFKNFGQWGNTRAGGVVVATGFGAPNYQILNNEFSNIVGSAVSLSGGTNCLIQGNRIIHVKEARGISALTTKDSRIIRNHIEETERTGIYSAGSMNTVVADNYIGKQGLHGNGVSSYQGDAGIVILRNRIDTGNIGITLKASSDFTIMGNIITTQANKVLSSWGSNSGYIRAMENIFYSSNKTSSMSKSSIDNFTQEVIMNNVSVGGLWDASPLKMNNIYLGLAWNESSRYGWALGAGEVIEPNYAKVFRDFAGADYRAQAGSPMLNKGADITPYINKARYPGVNFDLDFAGTPRVQNRIDIGPYEAP